MAVNVTVAGPPGSTFETQYGTVYEIKREAQAAGFDTGYDGNYGIRRLYDSQGRPVVFHGSKNEVYDPNILAQYGLSEGSSSAQNQSAPSSDSSLMMGLLFSQPSDLYQTRYNWAAEILKPTPVSIFPLITPPIVFSPTKSQEKIAPVIRQTSDVVALDIFNTAVERVKSDEQIVSFLKPVFGSGESKDNFVSNFSDFLAKRYSNPLKLS